MTHHVDEYCSLLKQFILLLNASTKQAEY